MGGPEDVGVDEGIALRSTGTLVAVDFASVGSGAVKYGRTVPIPGSVLIEHIQLVGPAASYPNLHEFQFGIGEVGATSDAEMNAFEPLFPGLRTGSLGNNWLLSYYPTIEGGFRVGRVVAMDGRRFMVRVRNRRSVAVSLAARFLLFAVVGGEPRAGSRFLSGNWLEER
jgi:hypothetical protein